MSPESVGMGPATTPSRTLWIEQIARGGPGMKQGRRLDSTNTEREGAPHDTHPNIGRSGDLTLRQKLP